MMKEYVIATDDVTELMKKLATNVIGEIQTELSITDGDQTKYIWFTPQRVASKGFTGTEVFHGWVSSNQEHPSNQQANDAFIQLEDTLLVLTVDL